MDAFLGVFLAGFLVLIGLTLLVRRKFGTILNPFSLYAMYFFLHSLVVPVAWHYVGLQPVTDAVYIKTEIYTVLHVTALGCCYLVNWSPFLGLLRSIHNLFPVPEFREKYVRAISIANLFQFAGVFLVLMVFSGAGLTWITDSRTAYQYNRAGVGVFWSMCAAVLFSGYLFYLCAKRPKGIMLAVMTLAFMGVSYFLGSKAIIVSFLLFGLFYYDIVVKKVSDSLVMISGTIGIFLGLILQVVQGTARDVMQLVQYFDYFNNTAKFLGMEASGQMQWGAVAISDLWFYVPRALYPDKPYSYGHNLITDMMCPGLSESAGYTPGLLTWSDYYWDFGIAGIIILAFFSGMFSKAAFEMLREKKTYVSFILFGQIGFVYGVHFFLNAPVPIFIIWGLSQWLLFGMVSKWMSDRKASARAAS